MADAQLEKNRRGPRLENRSIWSVSAACTPATSSRSPTPAKTSSSKAKTTSCPSTSAPPRRPTRRSTYPKSLIDRIVSAPRQFVRPARSGLRSPNTQAILTRWISCPQYGRIVLGPYRRGALAFARRGEREPEFIDYAVTGALAEWLT